MFNNIQQQTTDNNVGLIINKTNNEPTTILGWSSIQPTMNKQQHEFIINTTNDRKPTTTNQQQHLIDGQYNQQRLTIMDN
jgi:hypothetical protein